MVFPTIILTITQKIDFFICLFLCCVVCFLYNAGYVGGTRESFPPRQSTAVKCKVSDVYQKRFLLACAFGDLGGGPLTPGVLSHKKHGGARLKF